MQRKRTNGKPGAVIGWIVFIAVVAGGPLLNAIGSALGIPIPGYVLPALVALAVIVSLVGSVLRAIGGANAGDTRYPLPGASTPPAASPPVSRPVASMPPFGGEQGAPLWIPPARDMATPAAAAPRQADQAIKTPGFEPIFSGIAMLVGIVGIVVLVGLALFVLFP